MALAYETGVASSPTDLLQKLATWLADAGGGGWTIAYSDADGLGWALNIIDFPMCVNFRAAENERIFPMGGGQYADDGSGYGIGLYVSSDFLGGPNWWDQPGRPQLVSPGANYAFGVGMNLPAGSIARYHFFHNAGNHICVVVEKSPGIFVHMGWGPSLTKIGYPNDSWYFFASTMFKRVTYQGTLQGPAPGINATADAPMAHGNAISAYYPYARTAALVRVDAAVFAGRWIGNGQINSYPNPEWQTGSTGREMRCSLNQGGSGAGVNEGEYPSYRYLLNRAHQTAFTGALLLPLHQFVKTDPGGRWASIGYPPFIFWCDGVGHGYAAGEVKQVGADNYMLFPGFAVKKAA